MKKLHLESSMKCDDFYFRAAIGNLEARSVGDHLSSEKPHTTVEIVQWFAGEKSRYCVTVAYFLREESGYYLRFVGKRPVEDGVDWGNFKSLFELSDGVLEILFNAQKNEE